jgi:hypothetical protein
MSSSAPAQSSPTLATVDDSKSTIDLTRASTTLLKPLRQRFALSRSKQRSPTDELDEDEDEIIVSLNTRLVTGMALPGLADLQRRVQRARHVCWCRVCRVRRQHHVSDLVAHTWRQDRRPMLVSARIASQSQSQVPSPSQLRVKGPIANSPKDDRVVARMMKHRRRNMLRSRRQWQVEKQLSEAAAQNNVRKSPLSKAVDQEPVETVDELKTFCEDKTSATVPSSCDFVDILHGNSGSNSREVHVVDDCNSDESDEERHLADERRRRLSVTRRMRRMELSIQTVDSE